MVYSRIVIYRVASAPPPLTSEALFRESKNEKLDDSLGFDPYLTDAPVPKPDASLG